MEEIKVYSKPGCGQCMFTKKWLSDNGLGDYVVDIDITKDEEAYKHVQTLGHQSLPVVEYKGDNFSQFNIVRLEKLEKEFKNENSLL